METELFLCYTEHTIAKGACYVIKKMERSILHLQYGKIFPSQEFTGRQKHSLQDKHNNNLTTGARNGDSYGL